MTPRQPPRRPSFSPGDIPPGALAAVAAAIFLLALLLATWLGPRDVFDYGPALQGDPPGGEVVVVRVEEGEGLTSLGTKLADADVVRSSRLFRAMVDLRGYEGQLQAGDYEFRKNEAVGVVIERLFQGSTAALQATIPEGRRLEEAAAILDAEQVVPAAEFTKAASSRDYPQDFVKQIPEGRNLEGFLFPDTYQFSLRAGPSDIVGLMLATFERKVLTEDVRADLARTRMPLYEVVTLAAIVEREARVPEEQPIIASVFLNRIRQGIALQADPTVQYAVSLDEGSRSRFGYWKRDLTQQDLAIESPYNTYKQRGLPPGPIANPGRDAIVAVLRPATTTFLFFVAKPDGSHAFATTLEEHNRNVAQFQR